MAALALRARGFRVLARNLRTPCGEVDLLARERGDLVICEVKSRRGRGAVVVSATQQRRLVRAAHWLHRRYGGAGEGLRIDLVAVELPRRWWHGPRVRLHRAAIGEGVLESFVDPGEFHPW